MTVKVHSEVHEDSAEIFRGSFRLRSSDHKVYIRIASGLKRKCYEKGKKESNRNMFRLRALNPPPVQALRLRKFKRYEGNMKEWIKEYVPPLSSLPAPLYFVSLVSKIISACFRGALSVFPMYVSIVFTLIDKGVTVSLWGPPSAGFLPYEKANAQICFHSSGKHISVFKSHI